MADVVKPKIRTYQDALERIRSRLPFDVVETNLPGVFAIPAPEPGFDPNTASTAAQRKRGYLWRRPEQSSEPRPRKVWDSVFAMPWDPAKRVVPTLEVNRQHRHRRAPSQVKSSMTTLNWSGAEVLGDWGAVVGTWTVPQVSKPPEKHNEFRGWSSSTWIGIGGDSGSDDIVQAGTEQDVASNGSTHYYAWFEWVTTFARVTLPQKTSTSVAMCSTGPNGALGAAALFIAFAGEEGHVNFGVSTDDGNSLLTTLSTQETTSFAPALAQFFDGPVVAWAGHGNGKLNLADVGFNGVAMNFTNKRTFDNIVTPAGFALAQLNEVLFIAWRGEADRLSFAVSTDSGFTIGPTFESNETTKMSPALAFIGDTLKVGWKGDGNDALNVATVALDGAAVVGLADKALIGQNGQSAPSLASVNGVLLAAWKGESDDHISLMQSTDGGLTFKDLFVSFEKSPSGPTLTLHEEHVFIGFRGENDYVDLGVVGLRDGAIQGFSPNPPYLPEVKIKNFPVRVGDVISCSVFYIDNAQAAQISMGNHTTGESFSIVLTPAPWADVNGRWIEWIMEAVTVNETISVMPRFEPVVFSNAMGCGPNGFGDPSTGNAVTLTTTSNAVVTSEAIVEDGVTINFLG